MERQAAIDALCEHFAADRISMEEFERRVDQVNAADSLDQVRAALASSSRGEKPGLGSSRAGW